MLGGAKWLGHGIVLFVRSLYDRIPWGRVFHFLDDLWLVFGLIVVPVIVLLAPLLIMGVVFVIATSSVTGGLQGEPYSAVSAAVFHEIWPWSNISEGERLILNRVGDPFILCASFGLLYLPWAKFLIDWYRNRNGVVSTRRAGANMTRRRMARTLCHEFSCCEEIRIVSGTFGWFCENHEGREAFKALLAKSVDPTKLHIYSYRSKEEIAAKLKDISEADRQRFLELVRVDKSLVGLKLTIVSRLDDVRRAFFVCASPDGEGEEMVIVRDREYGRRLISLYLNYFPHANTLQEGCA